MSAATLVRWGNGQGVRLNRDVVEDAGIKVGDQLDVQVREGRIVLTPKRVRVISVPDLRRCLRATRGLGRRRTDLLAKSERNFYEGLSLW